MTPTRPERSLRGATLLISGGSRGIGLAIALRAARDGARVTLLAKTAEPHPRLPGTVFSAAQQNEEAGGQALPVVGDVRSDDDVARAVDQTVERFGGIDIVVNNASAIDLSSTADIPMKRYDLMQDINTRGSFLLAKTALPHLRRSRNAHVLTLSPPIDLDPRWAGSYLAYTIAKYGMSLVTLGLSAEWRGDGIAANSLWPRTTIATAAVQNPARRRRGHESLAQPGHHGRCGARRPDPQQSHVLRQLFPRRRGPRRGRNHRCRPLPVGGR